MWFGESFDPATYPLSGVEESVPRYTTVVLVAHVPQAVTVDEITTRIYCNGAILGAPPLKLSGAGDLSGATLGQLSFAGACRYELLDSSGSVLVAGNLTVSPP